MKKSKLISAMAIMVVGVMLYSSALSAFACTGFYMGKDTTNDGTSIWGRSEDLDATNSKIFTVHPAETHKEGEMFSFSNGFAYPYPAKTLRYSLVRDSKYNDDSYKGEAYGEAGINEENVAMSATVSLDGSAKMLGDGSGFKDSGYKDSNYKGGIDPLVQNGLVEEAMESVVLMQATSARSAIETIAKIVDQYGAGETNAITISDPKEIWYMEILSGHQYVAVKAPSDKIGLSPNIMMMGAVNVNDKDNVIASPNLIKMAQQAGTIQTDSNGNIEVAKSYNDPKTQVSNRLWQGYYYLKGEDAANALVPGWYDYYTDPRANGNKYTVYDAMRLLAYRGEGTARDAGDKTSNKYGIGNDNTLEAHVFVNRYDMPADYATVEWLNMGPAEFSVYIPYYSGQITETLKDFSTEDSPAYNTSGDNTVYWVFRQLYTLCKQNRANYGTNVKKFWGNYQKKLIEEQSAVDAQMKTVYAQNPQLAQQKATELGKQAAGEAYIYAKQMVTELQAFIDSGKSGVFMPTALAENKLPTYSFAALNGGSSDSKSNHHHSNKDKNSSSTTATAPTTATTTTATKHTYISDTTSDLHVDGSYTFKITSVDGKVPTIAVGTPGVFDVKLVKTAGNDYFYQIVAVGTPGASSGIYVNGESKLLVATVQSGASFVWCDTTKPFGVRTGASYLFKLKANTKPTFICGNGSAFQVTYFGNKGNEYYYKVTAVGKAGYHAGFYVNGEKSPRTVATIQ